jgi:hypothetical protein
VVRWSNSSYESTRESLPDADEEICKYACTRWRDESGCVCIYVHAYIRMYVGMGVYICTYVYTYVCRYVCIHTHTRVKNESIHRVVLNELLRPPGIELTTAECVLLASELPVLSVIPGTTKLN